MIYDVDGIRELPHPLSKKQKLRHYTSYIIILVNTIHQYINYTSYFVHR